MASTHDELSEDPAFGGAVVIAQRRQGYRFTADALWLVKESMAHAHGHIVDLGAGAGVIGLCLAQLARVSHVYLVERQTSLLACAARSIELSKPRCSVDLLAQDIRQLRREMLGEAVAMVVCNPPYYAAHKSRCAEDSEINSAKRALHGGGKDFAQAAERILGAKGWFLCAYPARDVRLALQFIGSAGFGIRQLRFVYSRPTLAARLVIIGARKGARDDVEILPPWFEYDANGAASAEALSLRLSSTLSVSA